jgi:hypothetical protein
MMRNIKVFILAFLLSNFAYAGGEMKKVCIEDAKTKKQVCKTVKVHKKLDGTTVPPKK